MNFLNKFLYLDLNLNDFLTIIFFIIIIFPLLIYFTNKICFSFGILDIPGERKNHKKPTPLSGGIVLCISIIIVYSFLKYVNYKNIDFFYEIILFSVIFFLFGIFDDLKPPSTKIKIVTIIILILLSIIVSDNLIISVLEFNYIFKRSIFLKSLSVFFTLFCIFMFFNALNYADGKNGISISYSVFILIYLGTLVQNNILIYFIILLLLILLYFNLKNLLFLGNSGVNLISIFISLLLIKIYNLNLSNNFYCDEIFLLMLIPGLDAARVTIYRIYKKKSPLFPDNKHFHHYLERIMNDNYIWIINLIICIMPIVILKFINNFYISLFIPVIIYFGLIKISQNIKFNS